MGVHYLRYIVAFFLTLAFALGGVAAFNYWANPFFAFGLGTDSVLSEYRTQAGTRTAKAEIMRRLEYRTLFLGSSRTAVGLNPESRWVKNKPAYNAGFTAGRIVEAHMALEYALEFRSLDTVLVLVDFSMFSAGPRDYTAKEDTRFDPDLNDQAYYTQMLLSERGLRYSFRALAKALSGEEAAYTLRGWKQVPRRSDDNSSPRHRFDVIIADLVHPSAFYTRLKYREGRLDPLRAIARRCHAEDIELIVAFSPLHATLTDSVHLLGKWKHFEKTKRAVLEFILEDAPDAAVWDFSVFSPETTEPIGTNRDREDLVYYSEASHFTGAMGDLVLRRTMGDGEPTHFGARLTPETIDAHLREQRHARDRWEAENPEEVERIKMLIAGVPVAELPKMKELTKRVETATAARATRN